MELALKDQIDEFEQAIFDSGQNTAAEAFPLLHHLTANGIYARELVLPPGAVITGKAKKEPYITVLSAGSVTEVTNSGTQHIKAPYTWVSAPGTKRVFRAYEQCVLVTIHKTTETELAKIEAEILEG